MVTLKSTNNGVTGPSVHSCSTALGRRRVRNFATARACRREDHRLQSLLPLLQSPIEADHRAACGRPECQRPIPGGDVKPRLKGMPKYEPKSHGEVVARETSEKQEEEQQQQEEEQQPQAKQQRGTGVLVVSSCEQPDSSASWTSGPLLLEVLVFWYAACSRPRAYINL